MADEKFNLSRRKTLAALGTIGAASAGAGLGTTAFFNDQETFQNNQLVAGTLDLKVDWQQRYYGPTESWVPVNAYPDSDGDGWQDGYTESDTPPNFSCSDLESGANLPDGVFAAPNRTDTNGGAIPSQDSLVALDDVKPGDKGEITFSLHLCDNPGYIWLTGDLVSANENSVTEPEADAKAEDGTPDSTDPDNVELLDAVKVEVWYDADCDNQRDDGETLILGNGDGEHTNDVSLREALNIMERLNGRIPLDGDTSTPMDWSDGATAESRDCFPGGTQHCIGVRWWLPTEVGNEIQSDSVKLDLGFYAEQCRHNDGAGMNAETVTPQ